MDSLTFLARTQREKSAPGIGEPAATKAYRFGGFAKHAAIRFERAANLPKQGGGCDHGVLHGLLSEGVMISRIRLQTPHGRFLTVRWCCSRRLAEEGSLSRHPDIEASNRGRLPRSSRRIPAKGIFKQYGALQQKPGDLIQRLGALFRRFGSVARQGHAEDA